MQNQAINGKLEQLARLGTKAQRRKKYKMIIQELGARHISLADIANGDKMPGFLEMLDKTGSTMDDAVILQQYANAIIDRDTRAAEFLRDTVGEKPSNTVDLTTNEGGLSKLSDEDLASLLTLLKEKEKE